jgi:hypothetical protein
MADFKGTILTAKGKNLLAKAITGTELNFTKVQLGDGIWDDSVNPEELTSLISPKLDLPIQELEVTGDGTARLRFVLTNAGLTEGFFTREIGIFANDPDEGEILYAVSYAENPDFIPADGVTKIEDVTDIYTVVSNAQNVTAVISDTVVLATKDDITESIESHNESTDAHQDIRNSLSTKAEKDLSNVLPQDVLSKILQVDGSGSGLDADLVRGLPADFSCSKNSAGYTKLPNGLIIQWATAVVTSNSSGYATYTFPIAFPNTCLVVSCVDNGGACVDYGVTQITNSSFTAYLRNSDGSVRVNSATGCRFIAIGY